MSGSSDNKNILDKAEDAVVYLYRLFHYATRNRPAPKPHPIQKVTKPPTAAPVVEPEVDESEPMELPARHEKRRAEIKKKFEKNLRLRRAHLRSLRDERKDLGRFSREIDDLLRQEEEDLRSCEHDINNLDNKD